MLCWMQHTVVPSPENTTAVVVVFVVDGDGDDDNDDASQFDLSATDHFQHLLLTSIGSCSSTKLVVYYVTMLLAIPVGLIINH